MPKEKNYNPVQEHKKQEKQKQIKKQKANLQAQRNEKLARRNPSRIQRDIDSLKEAEQAGRLRPHERQRLAELEKDLAAVNKAREALGDKAPQFRPERRHDDDDGAQGRHQGVLGKRTRGGQRKEDDSSDTDADVRNIPMPRDTPPPIPPQRNRQVHDQDAPTQPEPKKPQIVYEAAPQVRDFFKEATKFMPAAVANKIKLAKGEGRLLEPDEFDKLREEGYMDAKKPAAAAAAEEEEEEDAEMEALLRDARTTAMGDAEMAAEAAVQEAEYEMMAAEAGGGISGIRAEAAVAENKLRHVEMEEVADEDI
ncbi:hypothetical protein ACEQ8H_008025 [Pleosporales sp. CAS-2024a]